MRFLALAPLLFLSLPVFAADTDREIRVRVALALAATTPGCGACETNEPQCRTESMRTGKPLVLFVGGTGCNKCGPAAQKAGAVVCRVPSYDADGQGETPRAVVLTPNGEGGFWRFPSVTTDQAEVLKTLKEAQKPTPVAPVAKPLDWTAVPFLTFSQST